MHARQLSIRFRRALLAALAAPTLGACGGIADNGDAGPDGAVPICDSVQFDAGAVSCGGKTLQLSNAEACGIEDPQQIPQSLCQSLCGGEQYSCSYDASTDLLTCQSFCTGRLPAGLREVARAASPSAVGDWLARAAYLEAASIDAFAILASELRAHGAPRALVRSAQRAGADEVRHAREMGALAREFGSEPAAPSVGATKPRALVDVAIENAIEGCVRETYGALVARFQAERAGDPRVRRTMRRIARDETRHAALGWRVFEWTLARLDSAGRARAEAAMARAARDLEASVRAEPDPFVAATLGLPNAGQSRALVAALRTQLWRERVAA